jgi:hypothetical protein
MRRLSRDRAVVLLALVGALAGVGALVVALSRDSAESNRITSGARTPSGSALKGESSDGADGGSTLYAGGRGSGSLAAGARTTMASVSVPAGTYLIQAKATLYSQDPSVSGVSICNLRATAGSSEIPLDQTFVSVTPVTPVESRSGLTGEVLMLLGAATFTADQELSMSCATGTSGLNFGPTRITALTVGSAHGLPLAKSP